MHFDQALAQFNGITSFAIAAAVSWAILSEKVQDGIIIKIGLMFMAVGFFVTGWHLVDGIETQDLLALNRARALTNIGFLIALFGYWRQAKKGFGLADLINVKGAKKFLHGSK